MRPIFTLFATALVALPANAAVSDRSAHGFTSAHELRINASPERVFQAFTIELSQWWNAEHSYSGEASNFYLETKAGGCFCERLAEGSVEHMRLVFVDAPTKIRMQGALGPLQTMGVAGHMEFEFADDSGTTLLRYRYVVGGYYAGGLDTLADAVDQVQLGQLLRLKLYVETGRATAEPSPDG